MYFFGGDEEIRTIGKQMKIFEYFMPNVAMLQGHFFFFLNSFSHFSYISCNLYKNQMYTFFIFIIFNEIILNN